MPESMQAPHIARFEGFEVNLRSGELLQNGERVRVPEQSFQILAMLLERPGEVVSRQEIQNRLWPNNTVVEFENSINAAIKRLRIALGDSADEPRYVETLARRGYRWRFTVEWVKPGSAVPATAITTDTPRTPVRRWVLPAITCVLILIAGATYRLTKQRQPSLPNLPNVKLTQLTDNSPENPVSSGSISPDGKYVAYADLQGMHIKAVGSDEARSVPQPTEFKDMDVVWDVGAWFPDGRRFLVHSHLVPVSGDEWFSPSTSSWVVSLLGGAPRKLRNNAYAWDVSPDGSTIAYGTNFGGKKWDPGDETWLMSSDGSQARRILPRGLTCCVHFFPDGKRISYESDASLIASDLSGGSSTTLLSAAERRNLGGDLTWLPDGKLIYFDPCKHSDLMRSDTSCNYWVIQIDTQHGGIIDTPRRLTNWVGIFAGSPSVTADGKQVAFMQSSTRGLGYLAELDSSGSHVTRSRRFPPEESGENYISGWTADGKNAIVAMNRFDHYSVRIQAVDSDTESPILSSAAGLIERSTISPDGKWLLLLVFPPTGDPSVSTTDQLVRVPITGGTPEPIFSMREGSSMFCARMPATLCAVAEESQDRKTMIVTAFDPVKGRGAELARFDLIRDQEIDPNVDHSLLCNISPDGSQLAVVRSEDGPIEIHSLRGQPTFVIPAKRLRRPREIMWTADGKGFFVSNATEHSREIVHVDLRGNVDTLWTCSNRCSGWPSPDGRHLGIYNQSVSANMWMMENF
jgi:DNA-binding winged helix-turn-helix (wHTH) protein/Tol biopolymer transport system component